MLLLQIASSLLWALQAARSPIAPGTIVHEPIGCMVAGQFPLIEAAIEPSASVARARVYFKSALGSAYYFVEMTLQDGKFVGKLPTPKQEASPITYFVRVVTADGVENATDESRAQVVEDASQCPEGLRVAKVGPSGAVTVFNAATSTAANCNVAVDGSYPSWLGNLRIGVPQKASLMLGYVFRQAGWCGYDCDAGVLVAAEPGVGGGKLSIGFSKRQSRCTDSEWRAAKLTLLRTWNPWLADDRATYVGLELTTSVRFRPEFAVSLGLLRRVSAGGGSRDWVVTAGIGLGM